MLSMTPEQKEDQYTLFARPNIKKKRLHFKSIEVFPMCIIKYFGGMLSKVLIEENENYGGLN